MNGLSRDKLIESWMAREEAEAWFWLQRYRETCASNRVVVPVLSTNATTPCAGESGKEPT